MANLSLEALLEELRHQQDWLMVQDLDGVCMPLVLDRLTRVMPAAYIRSAARLQGRFCVLTNGEHAGLRGVNPLVERALAGTADPANEGLYLPGLAAGGVQRQDRFGQITYPGISDAELATLDALPAKILEGLREQLTPLLPELSEAEREAPTASCSTRAERSAPLSTGVRALRDGPLPPWAACFATSASSVGHAAHQTDAQPRQPAATRPESRSI